MLYSVSVNTELDLLFCKVQDYTQCLHGTSDTNLDRVLQQHL